MNGAQADIPAFLINIHKVESEADARDYISRIRATGTYIDQAVAESQEREKLGVLPPKWVFPQVIEQSKNLSPGRRSTPARTMTSSRTSRQKSASSPSRRHRRTR